MRFVGYFGLYLDGNSEESVVVEFQLLSRFVGLYSRLETGNLLCIDDVVQHPSQLDDSNGNLRLDSWTCSCFVYSHLHTSRLDDNNNSRQYAGGGGCGVLCCDVYHHHHTSRFVDNNYSRLYDGGGSWNNNVVVAHQYPSRFDGSSRQGTGEVEKMVLCVHPSRFVGNSRLDGDGLAW